LCQLTGDTIRLFPILRGLWEFYQLRAEHQTARELAEQLFALAQRQSDPALRLLAHDVLADTLLMLGEFHGAHEHAEQGTALYDVHQHHSNAFLYGYDFGIHCLSYVGWALWFLGYPDQALKKVQAALGLARDVSHPFTLVIALHVVNIVHHLRREAQAVREHAEAEIAFSTEQGFAFFLAGGSMHRGWALAMQDQGEEGIAQLRQELTAHRATGAEFAQPSYLAMLAEAYSKVGRAEEGQSTVDTALSLVAKTGERIYEAELYRLKGELSLQSRQVKTGPGSSETNSHLLNSQAQEEAEACFQKAIEIARGQQAKSLELRAVMSLVRLRQRQQQSRDHASRTTQPESHTKLTEAHKLLADLYHWFTEGFGTKDLQEAKVLLTELDTQV
jgi:predicted ATPase